MIGKHIKSIFGAGHSKAGKEFLKKKNKRTKAIEDTHLSKQTQKQLSNLSNADYVEIMKILNKRKK